MSEPLPPWSPTIVADAARWAGASTDYPGDWNLLLSGQSLAESLLVHVVVAAPRAVTLAECERVICETLWPSWSSMASREKRELRRMLGDDAKRVVGPFCNWNIAVARAAHHRLIDITPDGLLRPGPDVDDMYRFAGMLARVAIAWAWFERSKREVSDA